MGGSSRTRTPCWASQSKVPLRPPCGSVTEVKDPEQVVQKRGKRRRPGVVSEQVALKATRGRAIGRPFGLLGAAGAGGEGRACEMGVGAQREGYGVRGRCAVAPDGKPFPNANRKDPGKQKFWRWRREMGHHTVGDRGATQRPSGETGLQGLLVGRRLPGP